MEGCIRGFYRAGLELACTNFTHIPLAESQLYGPTQLQKKETEMQSSGVPRKGRQAKDEHITISAVQMKHKQNNWTRTLLFIIVS